MKIDWRMLVALAGVLVGVVFLTNYLLFGSSASASEIDHARVKCVDWISEEYEKVRHDAVGEFERQQDDELIFTVWGKETSYADRRTGITCVYNLETRRMMKPGAFNSRYH